MKALLLCLLLPFVTVSLQARTAPFLRDLFLACHNAPSLSMEEYAAWAELFLEVGDEEAANVAGLAFYAANYATRSPNPSTIECTLATFPSVDYLNNVFAWMYYLSGTETSRAYELIRKVKHHDAHSRDTYAMILLRMGHPAEALQQLFLVFDERKKVTVDDDNLIKETKKEMVLFDHAGDIFYKNGHYEEALRAWKASCERAVYLKDDLAFENEFISFNYDLTKTKQKYRALSKKVDALKDATTP